MEKNLIELLMNFFKICEEDAMSASMESVQNWDSLTHVELIMTLEEELDVPKITPDEIVMMTSLNDIKKVLINKGMTI